MTEISLDIDTPMINPLSGKPVRIVTVEKAMELGIVTNKDIDKRLEEFEISNLGDSLVQLFDVTPLSSANLFSIYNDIIISIRKARQQKEHVIKIHKDSLELFKSIFTNKPPTNPAHNKNVAFILECIDLAIAKHTVEN